MVMGACAAPKLQLGALLYHRRSPVLATPATGVFAGEARSTGSFPGRAWWWSTRAALQASARS